MHMHLHAGNLVDEVKAWRIPEARFEYCFKVKKILKILSDSGVPVMIALGNNDIETVVREVAPEIIICEKKSIVETAGENCRVGNEVKYVTFDCLWNLYGHGPTGDDWTLEQNVPDANWRFNVAYDSYLYSFEERKYFLFHQPTDF